MYCSCEVRTKLIVIGNQQYTRPICFVIGPTVLQSYCPTVLQSYSPTVLQSYSPTVLQSYSPTVLQSYCPTVLQSYCPTVPLSYCPAVLQSYSPTVLQSYSPTVPLFYCPTVLQSYSHTVLQSYSPTVLQSYSPTVLLSYSPTVLQSHCPHPVCVLIAANPERNKYIFVQTKSEIYPSYSTVQYSTDKLIKVTYSWNQSKLQEYAGVYVAGRISSTLGSFRSLFLGQIMYSTVQYSTVAVPSSTQPQSQEFSWEMPRTTCYPG